MANPNVDALWAKYTNLTERFFDRWQQVVDAARSGDLAAGEVSGAATEAFMDGVDAVTYPWLLLLDGELTFKKPLRTFRMAVDAAKADKVKRTRLKLDVAVTPQAQKLVNVDDPSKEIPANRIDASKTATAPHKLVIKLKNLGGLGVPEGIYEGTIVDTAAAKPIAKLIVEWPG